MILVVGATGHLGSEICRLLLEKGKNVKALVRSTSDQATVENLKRLGATLVEGDLTDRASIDAASKGVTAVISTATAIARPTGGTLKTVDIEGQLGLVDASRAAVVGHFIYISYSGNLKEDSPLHTAKRTVEEHIKNSGMTYTILRPTFFMEVWLTPILGFDPAKAKAQIFGSGEQKISWISFRDVAQFAVQCLNNPAASNAILELGGPEKLSPSEVVKIFEETSGRKFEVQLLSEDFLACQKAGTTDPVQKSLASLMLGYAQGDPIDMHETLKKFPVRMTSVRDFAARLTNK